MNREAMSTARKKEVAEWLWIIRGGYSQYFPYLLDEVDAMPKWRGTRAEYQKLAENLFEYVESRGGDTNQFTYHDYDNMTTLDD